MADSGWIHLLVHSSCSFPIWHTLDRHLSPGGMAAPEYSDSVIEVLEPLDQGGQGADPFLGFPRLGIAVALEALMLEYYGLPDLHRPYSLRLRRCVVGHTGMCMGDPVKLRYRDFTHHG